MTNTIPLLTPRVANWMKFLCLNPNVLSDLLSEYGSPINIHHTDEFKQNIKELEDVLDQAEIPHLVQFARKANKCKAFVHASRIHGCGVDTASERELQECLDAGVDPQKLILTAAVKTRSMLELAVGHQVMVVVDNEDECRLVNSVAAGLQINAQLGIRISGFETDTGKLYSRFGFDLKTVPDLLENWTQEGLQHLSYRGLHFHLNGYSIPHRGQALLQSLGLAEELKQAGFVTDFIDMGGGLLMNYLKKAEQWLNFQRELKKAVKGEREPITFGNNGLGFQMVNEQLHGSLNTYPYFNTTPRKTFLSRVLEVQDEAGESVGSRLAASGITLRLEPGRCLLDQCGFTLARVASRKRDARGDWLIGLEMNMTQMHSSSADFLLDPLLIPRTEPQEDGPVQVYLTGAYCLERDVLLQRKICLPSFPEVGDMMVFFNTAGYMMHFFESEAHLFDLAKNIIYRAGTSSLSGDHFYADENSMDFLFQAQE
ncbi:Y4yA family PLP-dependent enzyme [Kiritimatiellaeota bacterium B1221]|nr:Y4yA family PLP-dependent enzyme [Kiritimatiellaeota bacterium B1221]